MVDYSKWDHLDISDDDDNNDGSSDNGRDYGSFGLPGTDEMFVEGVKQGGNNSSITKLTPGTSVTFGKGTIQYGKKQQRQQAEQQQVTQTPPIADTYKRLTRNGGGREDQSSTHIWGQTRDEVRICVFVPAGTRGNDVIVSVKPVVGENPRLKVCCRGKALVDGALAHPVDTSEDALVGCYTLEDYDKTRRVVNVELKKSTVGSSAFWWDRALASDPCVSKDAIVDMDRSDAAEENRRKWQEAWEEAHKTFKEQVANQKPLKIDP